MGKAELVAELTVGELAAALPAMSVLAIMRRVTVLGWQEWIEFYALLNDEQLEALERARQIGDRRLEIGDRRPGVMADGESVGGDGRGTVYFDVSG